MRVIRVTSGERSSLGTNSRVTSFADGTRECQEAWRMRKMLWPFMQRDLVSFNKKANVNMISFYSRNFELIWYKV